MATSINDLTVKDIAAIKGRILAGEFQHEIASDYGLNQGRINEIAKGKRFAEINPKRNIKPKTKAFRKIIKFSK